MSKRTCVVCGSTLSGRGRRLYCSPACSLVERECECCGKVDLIQRKRIGRPYCSQGCAKISNGLKMRVEFVSMDCQFCGVTFDLYPSQATPRRKFCSKTCAGFGRPIDGRPSKIANDAISVFAESFQGRMEPELRVGRFSVDLALPDLMIAIELNGVYWHSLPAMIEKDKRKMAVLRSEGWHPVIVTIHKDSTPELLASEIASAVSAFVAQGVPTCRHS